MELENHDFKGTFSPNLHYENSNNSPEMDLVTGNRCYTQEDNIKHQTCIDFESFMKAKAEFSIKDNTANLGPLAIFGFGLTTCLLSLHNAGVFPLNAIIFSMAICYGGFAQIIAGLFEWYKGNMFSSVAFLS